MLRKHLAVMFLLVMATGAFAQSIPSGTGRIEALGNSPFILDAATDIFNNPAWNNYYRNYIFGDFGRNNTGSDFSLTNQYGAINFGAGKKWALGMILNKPSDNWSAFNTSTNGFRPDSLGISGPIVPFMGLIGYQASKNFMLGLAPYYTSWGAKSTTNDTTGGGARTFELSSHSLGANLGFNYMLKNKQWVEGVVNFRMNKYKSVVTIGNTTTTTDNTGGMQIGANFRGWLYPAKGSKVALVPIVGFSIYSFQPEQVTTTTRTGLNYSWLNLNGGAGLNWPVTDDIQIAAGFVVYYSSQKADSGTVTMKTTNLTIPRFNIACETRIADWLTARFGYDRSISLYDNTNTAGSITNEFQGSIPSSDDQTISIGTGFHFGRFSVDATVAEKWLKHGINFISGNNSANTDLFGVISASYNFNK